MPYFSVQSNYTWKSITIRVSDTVSDLFDTSVRIIFHKLDFIFTYNLALDTFKQDLGLVNFRFKTDHANSSLRFVASENFAFVFFFIIYSLIDCLSLRSNILYEIILFLSLHW